MSVVLAAIMTVGLLSGCGTSKESDSKEGEQVTLNYWTWFPSTDQIEETVKAFEKENPDIKTLKPHFLRNRSIPRVCRIS